LNAFLDRVIPPLAASFCFVFLAFYGAPFLPGEYHERVAPVDLAVTFASLAGVNQPSAADGRVVTEAMKPFH
jgi:hypothetical protein